MENQDIVTTEEVVQDVVVENEVAQVEVSEVSDKPTVIVKDQAGEEVKRFDSVQEGYAYASENGLQVEIR